MLQDARRLHHLHDRSVALWKKVQYAIVVPSAALSSISGIVSFVYGLSDATIPVTVKYALGAINFAAVGLAAATGTLQPDAHKQDHAAAKTAYGNIIRNIGLEMTFGPNERTIEGDSFVHELVEDLNRCLETSPRIMKRVARAYAPPPATDKEAPIDFLDSNARPP